MRLVGALAAAVLMVAAAGARAQGPWLGDDRILPSAAGGGATALAATPEGGLVVAGRAGGRPRMVLLGPDGRVADDLVLAGSDAVPVAIAASPAAGPGAYAVVAGPADPPGYERGLALWRLVPGADGRLWQDWFRRFRRTALDGGAGAVGLDDGGLMVAGWTGGRDRPSDGAWMLRLDAEGEAAWRRLALPTTPDGVFAARAAAKGPKGELLVAAYGAPAAGAAGGVWLLRFDLFGNDYSQKVIDEAEDERPAALAALADGGTAVAGSIAPDPVQGAAEAWLVRCDDKGDILWDRRFGEGGLTGVAALPDGGLVLAGWLAGPRGGAEGWLARLDAGGATVWERRLGGPGARFDALTLLADGTAAAAGSRTVKGRAQMWVVRFRY